MNKLNIVKFKRKIIKNQKAACRFRISKRPGRVLKPITLFPKQLTLSAPFSPIEMKTTLFLSMFFIFKPVLPIPLRLETESLSEGLLNDLANEAAFEGTKDQLRKGLERKPNNSHPVTKLHSVPDHRKIPLTSLSPTIIGTGF